MTCIEQREKHEKQFRKEKLHLYTSECRELRKIILGKNTKK